jgi:hypothetical protein
VAIGGSRKLKDLGNNPNKKRNITFGDLLIPLMGLFIFLLLTIFVYVPMLFTGDNSYLELRSQIDEIDLNAQALNAKLAAIEPISANSAKLNSDLRVVTTIIPPTLDVSDFTYYVDQLAKDSLLDFREISSGDITVSSGNSNDAVSNNVSGVSGPIVYEGRYKNIVEFLDILQEQSPYIVESSTIFMREIKVDPDSSDAANNFWRIELNITGYYIAQDATQGYGVFNAYQPFVPYTNFNDIFKVFESKNDILKEKDSQKESANEENTQQADQEETVDQEPSE